MIYNMNQKKQLEKRIVKTHFQCNNTSLLVPCRILCPAIRITWIPKCNISFASLLLDLGPWTLVCWGGLPHNVSLHLVRGVATLTYPKRKEGKMLFSRALGGLWN
jgi:hypothetical protein